MHALIVIKRAYRGIYDQRARAKETLQIMIALWMGIVRCTIQ